MLFLQQRANTGVSNIATGLSTMKAMPQATFGSGALARRLCSTVGRNVLLCRANGGLQLMTLPKFIITMDGHFRLGMVNQHKDLLKPGDQCIGGGYYRFDFISNRIILDRESYDFGM